MNKNIFTMVRDDQDGRRVDPQEFEVWRSVYCAAIQAGIHGLHSIERADEALDAFRHMKNKSMRSKDTNNI